MLYNNKVKYVIIKWKEEAVNVADTVCLAVATACLQVSDKAHKTV